MSDRSPTAARRTRPNLVLDVALFSPRGNSSPCCSCRQRRVVDARASGGPFQQTRFASMSRSTTQPRESRGRRSARPLPWSSKPLRLAAPAATPTVPTCAFRTSVSHRTLALAVRGATWTSVSDLPPLPARQREEIDSALAAIRARVDQQPIAFRLLPAAFTLTDLQSVYELLLGRRLHKASFRRSLHASALVEATDEWRGEGRGRPAQLFRYAPPRRRRQRRGVRFDLLG